MAKKKINDLTLATSVTSSMQFETDISGATANKVTADQITSFVTGGIDLSNVPTSDQKDALDASNTPSSSNAYATALDISVKANDADVVHLAGLEDITGPKSFSDKTIFNAVVNFNTLDANELLLLDNTKNLTSTPNTLPTSDEKNALAGNNPSASNKYATIADLPSLPADGVTGTFAANNQLPYSSGNHALTSSSKYVVESDTNSSKIKAVSPDGTKNISIEANQFSNTSQLNTNSGTLEIYSNGAKAIDVGPTQGVTITGSVSASNLSNTNTGDETNSSIKTKLGQASTSTDGWVSGTDFSKFNSVSALNPLSLTNPTAGQMLGYNGSTWLNVDKGALVGNGISFYLTDSVLINQGNQSDFKVKEMSKESSLSSAVTESIAVTNESKIITAFLYNNPINVSAISGGSWQETIFRSVSALSGANYIKTGGYIVKYQATATVTITGTGTSRTATATNTPFIAGDANADIKQCSYLQTVDGLFPITGYTSSSVCTITVPSTYANESSITFTKWSKILLFTTGDILTTGITIEWVDPVGTSLISTNFNDKIGFIFFAQTTSVTPVTLSFSHGDPTTDSYFITPLVTGHNQLPDVQGGNVSGNDVQHLTTTQVGLLPTSLQKQALTASNNPSSTNAYATMLDVNSLDVAQSKVIFRSQVGNDANNGTTLNKAVNSLYQGVVLATSQSPSYSNQWCVTSFDAGYDSNVYDEPYIHIYAPMMRLLGTNKFKDNCVIRVKEFNGSNSQSIWCTAGAGVDPSYFYADRFWNGYITIDANQGHRYFIIPLIDRTSSGVQLMTIYGGSTAHFLSLKMVGNIVLDGTTSYVDLRNVADVSGLTFTYQNGATSAQVYLPIIGSGTNGQVAEFNSSNSLTSTKASTASSTASTYVTRDANINTAANSFIEGWATTSGAGTTSLTNVDAPRQEFTGASARTIFLPAGTAMYLYQTYIIVNKRSVNIPVLIQDGSTLTTVAAGSTVAIICTNNTTNNGSWSVVDVQYSFEASTSNYKMSGTASVGTVNTVARPDHIHPRSIFTYYANNTGTQSTGLTAGSKIVYNSLTSDSGANAPAISLATNNFTLPTGFKYEFLGSTNALYSDSAGYMNVRMYNNTAAAYFGFSSANAPVHNPNGQDSDSVFIAEVSNTSGSNISVSAMISSVYGVSSINPYPSQGFFLKITATRL